MVWDLVQQFQIHDAREQADRARGDASRVERQLDRSQERHAALALRCQALWEILRDRLGVTDQELLEKMNEIDLRDGRLDGRMSPLIHACPSCERKSKTRTGRCLYCGAQMPRDNVFA